MNSLTLPPTHAQQAPLAPTIPAVYIDGQRTRDLAVRQWELLPAPVFGTAELVRVGSGVEVLPARFGDPSLLPPIGSKVKILSPHGSASGVFLGEVVAHEFEIDEDGERCLAKCRHQLAGNMSDKLTGLWQISQQCPVWLGNTKVLFNGSRHGQASSSVHSLGGRLCKMFDSGPTSSAWSLADALGYILAVSVPSEMEVPGVDELESMAGGIALGRADVSGMATGEAMVQLLRRGNLAARAGRDGSSIVLYRPGSQGKRRGIRLQRSGQNLSTHKTNLWQASVTVAKRPSRPSVIALGQRKKYESTFTLAKGWDTDLETNRWRDFVQSSSPNWPKLATVYRKWVLNEHGWYSGKPWSLPIHDFADISSEDFLSRRARRFLPCLSCDAHGQNFPVIVEYRCCPDGSWRRWAGPVWVSSHQCAINLGGDSLPGDFFQAAISDELDVRVTCVVEADKPITVEIAGDANIPREVLDLSDVAGWSRVHSGSILLGAEDTGKANERDDTALAMKLAKRQAESKYVATEADLTLGWVDTSLQAGDIVERVDGRQFELSSNPDIQPVVVSVLHNLSPKHTTRIRVRG